MRICKGTIFMVIMLAFIGLLGGSASAAWVIDTASLVIVLVPLMFFLYISGSGKAIVRYVGDGFKKDYVYTQSELMDIACALKHAIKFTIATGVFGLIAGLVVCLFSLSAPEHLGPAVSVSLITVLYAVGIGYFIFFPAQVWVENQLRRGQYPGPPTSERENQSPYSTRQQEIETQTE